MIIKTYVQSLIALMVGFSIFACNAQSSDKQVTNNQLEPCSAQWQTYVDKTLITGDGQGHGPDLGSDEWKSVVEFKLKVRGQKNVPARDSKEWCLFVDKLLVSKGANNE